MSSDNTDKDYSIESEISDYLFPLIIKEEEEKRYRKKA